MLLGKLTELDAIGTINLLRDGLNLLLDGLVQAIEELKLGLPFTDLDNCLGEINGTGTTFSPVIADDSCISAGSERLLSNELKLSVRVGSNFGLSNCRYFKTSRYITLTQTC